MLRGLLKRLTDRLSPAVDKITSSPFVLRYLPALADPDLWHLNRHSAARAVAIGLFCGLIPGPLQALGSILLCMALRANVPSRSHRSRTRSIPLYVVAYSTAAVLPEADAASDGACPFAGLIDWFRSSCTGWRSSASLRSQLTLSRHWPIASPRSSRYRLPLAQA
jgi:hypothetical protein